MKLLSKKEVKEQIKSGQTCGYHLVCPDFCDKCKLKCMRNIKCKSYSKDEYVKLLKEKSRLRREALMLCARIIEATAYSVDLRSNEEVVRR